MIQPIDFRLVSFNQLFHKKKEAYKMKVSKLKEIDCQLCKLIFDYTSICPHYQHLNPSEMEDLKDMMPHI